MFTAIKECLNRSRSLRALLFPLLWLRRKVLGYRVATLMRYYDEVVIGGHLVIEPGNFPGQFKVDATSDLAKRVLKTGAFEPELTALLSRFSRISRDVINIGANVGFYSILFAKTYPNIRKVIAIEPNPEAFTLLKWNIEANGVEDRVEPLQLCIGDTPGQLDFSFIPGKSEYSSIGGIVHASVAGLKQEQFTVNVLPLEETALGFPLDPELIFIDTEGAELLVLKGAEAVLKNSLPLIVLECEDDLLRKFDHSSELVESYLEGLGYVIRNALEPKLKLTHPFTGVAVAVPVARGDWLNILLGNIAE